MNTPEQYFRDMAAHLKTKVEFWRQNPDDPHGINIAVYAALSEMLCVVAATLNEPSPKQDQDCCAQAIHEATSKLK